MFVENNTFPYSYPSDQFTNVVRTTKQYKSNHKPATVKVQIFPPKLMQPFIFPVMQFYKAFIL